MAKEVAVKTLCKYNGHSLKNNKAVNLSLKFNYDELPNYIKLIQLLNENVDIEIKNGSDPMVKIGMFMVQEIKIDHDGTGVVRFNSQMDHVEADNINYMVGDDIFKVRFKASVEVEAEDEELTN